MLFLLELILLPSYRSKIVESMSNSPPTFLMVLCSFSTEIVLSTSRAISREADGKGTGSLNINFEF